MSIGRPGEDLAIAAGPGIPRGLVVPAADLTERFSRSSGPGGQSVNTTDSRVELLVDVAGSQAFSDTQRARLRDRLGDLVDGCLSVVASEHRSQHRNRSAARERAAEQIRAALAPPPPSRRATRPTRGSQRRRLAAKQRRGQVKSLRGRVHDSD